MPLQFHPQFVVRTPLFPLKKAEDNSLFREGIYITSPSLYNEHQKQLNATLTDAKELKKLSVSLHKYSTRASMRCTPFGLFAGLGNGSFDTQSKVVLSTNTATSVQRNTRLDMNVLCALAQELATQSYIQPHLVFYTNKSVYQIENQYRYVEYYYTNNKRIHKISKVDFSDYLQLLLTQAQQGKTIAQLCALLVNDDITYDEVNAFVHELITSQLLISDLEPTVTGADFLEVIIKISTAIYSTAPCAELEEILQLLNKIKNELITLDASLVNTTAPYQSIFNQLKQIVPTITETNLFQTDLFKRYETATLSTDVQTSILSTLSFLNKITPPNTNPSLINFKNKFTERYEDTEIPLLQALDTETGIGYPNKDTNGINDLVDDLYLANRATEGDIKWNAYQSCLHKLLIKSIAQQQTVIHISEHDFKDIDFTTNKLPYSFSILFKLFDSNNRLFFKLAGGSSAINLLGRFGNGSTELLSTIHTIATHEAEQVGNAILAEIVHLPESRTGNILARPSFRAYEIPYLAKASVAKEFQLTPSDLYLSIKGNSILLRSKRLNKKILPRLGNAHNFSFNALPVYQFLCDLQVQHFDKYSLGFNWGALANQYSFLPRVEYNNVVLSSAKWQLQKHDFEKLTKPLNEAESIRLFYEFKQTHKLPDAFLIVDGDNELLIDTSQNIAIATFIDSLKNRQSITLEEFLFDENNPLVTDSNGNGFTNECIATVLNPDNKLQQQELKEPIVYTSQKQFSIGSEWLYYKIYCGVKTADYILTQKIKPIVAHLLGNNSIDKWFFIRYSDPETHLRFRLHLTDIRHHQLIIELINKELAPLLQQNVITKLQTDTYMRELERYGDNSMELTETLFYYDSECCVNSIDLLDVETGNAIRWQFALRATDQLLTDFNLTLQQKMELMTWLSQSFFKEHGGNKELQLQLNEKYRKLRKEVETTLNRALDTENEMYPLLQLLEHKTQHTKDVIAQLLKLKEANQLQINFNDLMCSYAHMLLNRVFMAKQRTNEFIIYDLLQRHYKSMLARIKLSTN